MASFFKKFLYLGAIALALFSTSVSRAQANSGHDLGYSYMTAIGDGSTFTDEGGIRTLTCTLYCENGKACGEASFKIYAPDNVVGTFHLNGGMATLKFKLELNATSDPSIVTAHGMDEMVMSTSGLFSRLTGVDHRCIFEVDANGMPIKCLKCVYLFKF